MLSFRLWVCTSLTRDSIHHGKNPLKAKMAVGKRLWFSYHNYLEMFEVINVMFIYSPQLKYTV